MKIRYLLFSFVVLGGAAAAYSQATAPAKAVSSFYRFSDARSSTFNSRHLKARKQWYTPDLYNAFRAQLRKDRENLRLNPTDKPYFGDGLDFGPLREACASKGRRYYRQRAIGRQTIRGNGATVPVRFAYPRACSIADVIYKIELRKVSGRWLIDDIRFDDGRSIKQEMREFTY